MSRIANLPIKLPNGVAVEQADGEIKVKGPKGELQLSCPEAVTVAVEDGVVQVKPNEHAKNTALAGTIRAILGNHVHGVSEGFERKLELVGVGYRAQMQGAKLNLTLGYSHPIEFEVPEGVTIETPSATEVVVKGTDRQKVGQVAANIRAFRPPEPYKGKGVKYKDERIVRKEAKKK
ncbi:ribosomal protein L6 [Thioalkalivibrio sp. K90mix]|uniref:50S ribosomal protein L6 n=1 Tax=Thioalkalivibrio sp. (strain K90mix) TaxID=396595 RepID=UPI00019591EF|nr:50S ribosomal protein L6 [Thioalkalivibrio sp. K90mix]ADC72644.1 ribosomal protein L6 [Thioalkalivibrio sp. K90mix]